MYLFFSKITNLSRVLYSFHCVNIYMKHLCLLKLKVDSKQILLVFFLYCNIYNSITLLNHDFICKEWIRKLNLVLFIYISVKTPDGGQEPSFDYMVWKKQKQKHSWRHSLNFMISKFSHNCGTLKGFPETQYLMI